MMKRQEPLSSAARALRVPRNCFNAAQDDFKKTSKLFRCAASVASAVLATLASLPVLQAQGAEVVNVNGSFDDQVGSITGLSGTQFGQTFPSITGWTQSGSGNLTLANGDVNGPPFYAGNGSTIPFTYPNDGGTYLTFNSANYTLTQGITDLAPNQPVTVSFDLVRLEAVTGTGATTAQVELFDGADATAPVLYDSGTINVRLLAQETWIPFSSGPLINTGNDMFLRLSLFDNTSGALGGIDNVVVTGTPVPEPPTIVLWTMALAGLGLMIGWRQRKATLNHRCSR